MTTVACSKGHYHEVPEPWFRISFEAPEVIATIVPCTRVPCSGRIILKRHQFAREAPPS